MANPPFETVVETHGALVWRVCRALLGEADADDAWSETFLAALRAYPGLAADSNVAAWLVTIAHRKALDSIRATGRRAVPIAQLPAAAATPTGSAAEHHDLWQAVAALPFKQRSALVHRHLVGLSYEEIADLLASSPAAARRSVSDALASLRRDHHLRPEPPSPTEGRP